MKWKIRFLGLVLLFAPELGVTFMSRALMQPEMQAELRRFLARVEG